MADYAPGMRVLIRDEEWMIRKCDPNSFKTYTLQRVGVSPLVRDKTAYFLSDLEKITVIDPAKTALIPDHSARFTRSRLFLESQWRQKIPTDTKLHVSSPVNGAGHREMLESTPEKRSKQGWMRNMTTITSTVHAFLVGISDYSAINGACDLPYCNNDIVFMSKALQFGLCVDPHNILMLGQHKTVTKNDFIVTIKHFLSSVSANDTLIFYYSGHGYVSQDGKHNFVFSDGCIPTQIVVDLFDQIPAKNRIVLIDSCMSGNYSLSLPKPIDPISWIEGFVEHGCVVLSSCDKTEQSRFHPNAPISLFTVFLCEAFTSPNTIRKGNKSFEDIKEWVLLRARAWNAQHPDKKQTPTFRSNVGGTVMFKVENWKPYTSGEFYAEHDGYIIYSIEPIHTGIAKRYSVKVILKQPSTADDVAKLSTKIVSELENVEIYQSEQFEKRWRTKKPNMIFMYFGYDISDIANANYAYRTIWVDDKQDRNWWYRASKDSAIINDINVIVIPYYDMMHKFNLDHTDDADHLVKQTKDIMGKMISNAELVICEFREYQNGSIDENEYIQHCTPFFEEISRLYFAQSELEIPPVELNEWSQKYSNIAATIHDFTLFYSEKFLKERTPENRIQCMKMAIRTYQDELQDLKKVEESSHLIGLPANSATRMKLK